MWIMNTLNRMPSLALLTCLLGHTLAIGYLDTFQNFSDFGHIAFRHSQKIYHPAPEGSQGHGEAFSSAAFSLGNGPPSKEFIPFSGPSYGGFGSFEESGPGLDTLEFPKNSLESALGNNLGGYRHHVPFNLHGNRPQHRPHLPPDNSLNPGYPFLPPPQVCQPPVIGPCQLSKFRTIDGSCNNLRNPSLGTPNTRYNRLLPARYADGVHLPPTSVVGGRLPGARLVSIVMFPDKPINDPVWTLISMQWGQIITHDMSMAMGTTQTSNDEGKQIIFSKQQESAADSSSEEDGVIPTSVKKFEKKLHNFEKALEKIEGKLEKVLEETDTSEEDERGEPLANHCCSPDGRLQIPHEQAPAQCFPIEIPGDDPLYSKYGQMCMNFMRSTTDIDTGCLPPRSKAHEQLVTVTHYMDASLVYGSSFDTASALRQGYGGRMRVDVRGGRQWPPSAVNKSATCETQDDDEPCYRFGDVRANQNPQLTVLQIVLLREHNRIADALQHLNPHWDDERIFQEARRILIAEYQHINYAEWLPIFIGTKNMMKHGLLFKSEGYVNDYREDVDPSVLNDHATAAFRYFHSAIQGHLHLIGEQRNVFGALRLSDYFNRPGIIEVGDNMDKLTRGMSTQNEEEVDPFLTSEITDYLFRNGKPFGRDLRAIDIQRGRDHGLASYNNFRQFCGLPRARKWEDFTDFISPQNVEKLSIIYNHPDDVDLVVGGSLEAHIKDTLSGPTFLCIMTEQFYRTRVADRFFYERGDHPGAFTPEQLREIRKATVSRLLCDNGDDIKVMQPEGFRVIGDKNPLVPCENTRAIPALDLRYWKEEVPAGHGHFNPRIPQYDFFGKK